MTAPQDPPVSSGDDFENLDPIDPSTLQPMDDDEGHGMRGGVATVEHDQPLTLISPARFVARGVDVSAYDAKAGVNWRSLYTAGYRFAWVKIGEGVTYYNPYAAGTIAAARAAGLKVGGYWFCQPGSGAQQAALMLALPQTPRGAGDLVPIMDLEVFGLGTAFARAFAEQVKIQLGVPAGSYSSRSYFQTTLRAGAGWELPGSVRWIAAYGGSSAGIACDVWQNSSSTIPAGTNRQTDTDIAYTPLAKMTVGGAGSTGESGSYVPLTPAQITAMGGYQDGQPLVAGIRSAYPIKSVDSAGKLHFSTSDARCVPANLAPRLWNGSGRNDYLASLWVNFVRDLMMLPSWARVSADGEWHSWAEHYGVQLGGSHEVRGYFSDALAACVREWARQHGLPKTDEAYVRGVTTPAWWAQVLGQKKKP